MIISIPDAVSATDIFIAIFLIASIISIRKKTDSALFPLSLTQELKGLAILAIVFSHIGYFLVDDHRFLFPLTVLAGVGVNLFLFLSGYGLAFSHSRKRISPWQFYRQRLAKLLLPFWISLAAFFLLDLSVLHHGYGWNYTLRSFLGFFPHADLYEDINSPLWYLTLILSYYLVFPWIFSKKRPWLSALAIYGLSLILIWINPSWLSGVRHLYRVHLLAFPLGILASAWLNRPDAGKAVLARLTKLKGPLRAAAYWLSIAALIALTIYTSLYYSGVGTGPIQEELISLVTTLALASLFVIKRREIRLWQLFGAYSYEIYLLHWPLLYHYDIFYRFLPAWLATMLYLGFFLGLSWLLKKLSVLIARPRPKSL